MSVTSPTALQKVVDDKRCPYCGAREYKHSYQPMYELRGERDFAREKVKAIRRAYRAMVECKRCGGRGEYESEWEAGGDKVWARCDCRKTLEQAMGGKL